MSALVAGTVMLTALGLFSQLVGFAYRIALSRLVGAETMGLYQLVMPVYSLFMSVTAVGLTVAVSTLSARFSALGDRGAVRQTLRRALACFFAVAIPLGVVTAAGSDPISVYLIGDARTRLGVVLLMPCVLLTGVENLHKHCFYGMGRVGVPAAVETMEQLIRVGAVLTLLIVLRPASGEGKVGAIVSGMVLCEVFSAVTLTVLLRRHWNRETVAPPRHRVTARQLARIALPVGMTSLLGTLLGSANAVLIPARLVAGGMEASKAMASFGVMCGMTLPLLSLPTGFVGALCLVLVPELVRKTEEGDRRGVGRLLGRMLQLTSALLAPAMALLAVIGPTVGQAVYHEPEVGSHITWLAVGMLLSCWQSVLSGALNGMGLQKQGAVNAILSDAVQLAFTVFTVSKWGMGGFAAGFVLSSLVGMGLNLQCVIRAAGLSLRPYRWFGRPLLGAGLVWAWCRLFFRILQDAQFPLMGACGLCAAMGTALYIAAMQAQGCSLKGTFAALKRNMRRTQR
ncbi:MAG: oligosaccharide flippase family protein [Oscillospiraceae bacterium]|nr:oligosaccharide flippase family protein [Oscillospiraceae bacterium]